MAVYLDAMIAYDGGSIGSSHVKVGTDELSQFGDYLVASEAELDELLDSLNKAFADVTGAWGDNDGALLVSKFNDFIASVKMINSEMSTLGRFASGEALKYDEIVQNSIDMMGA